MSNGDKIVDDFLEYCRSAKRLVIYGAGAVGCMVHEFLHAMKIPVYCFAVTGEPHESPIFGVPLYRVNDLDKNDTVIIAASRSIASAMYDNALKRFANVYYNSELLYRVYLEKCRNASERVVISGGLIKAVAGTKLCEDFFYVSCPASIGDTLYVAGLIREFKRYIDYKKVCLIVKPRHAEVVAIFPDVDEIISSDDMVNTFDMFSVYTQTFRLKNYLYGHLKKDRRLQMDSRYYKNDNNDILSRYRNLIFDINCKNASVTLGRNNIIEHMGRHEEKGDGKSEYVVIMPYAKSAPMMSLEFWNMLVDELLFRNLKIFTNVGDKREKAIVGTDIINEEIMETAYFCNSAKAVISIRSGMCDVLGLTDSKIIVLNTSEEMSEKWDLSYLWGSKRIKNIDTWDMDDKEIIDVIMKHL